MTLSIFPGVLADDVESEALGSWYPILLIFTFNVADMVSKMSTTFFLFGDRFFVSVFTFCTSPPPPRTRCHLARPAAPRASRPEPEGERSRRWDAAAEL